jgi:hypothetical protein
MLEQVKVGKHAQDLKMNVLQAIQYIIQGWNNVTAETIYNCWWYTKILPIDTNVRTPNITNITNIPYTKNFNFINIDPRKIKFISLDLFYQDDSNESKMIKIQSLDCLKTGVCRIKNFLKYP